MSQRYDYLIVGAGIVGMTIAYELLERKENTAILIIDKESNVAKHASGRNSGVLHAGFYYTEDSLKARFTVEGNKLMRAFCQQQNIFVRQTKKLVIAQNSVELEGLYELEKRAKVNGVDVLLLDEKEALKIEPNVNTYQKALFSPTTASVDPVEVCLKLKEYLESRGVTFMFNTPFEAFKQRYQYDYLINAAGAYADKIAKQFGLAQKYTMLPFKGIYLKYMENDHPVSTNIYPVPNLNNPFLGVHYTVTVDGSIKIGPTAIPALWRENYRGLSRFKFSEMVEILYYCTKLFMLNKFNFRKLAINEMSNYRKNVFIAKAKKMVKCIGNDFTSMKAGIRAQLLNTETDELVQDFIVEHAKGMTHILNAVSPAFTCSFAFAQYIVDEIDKNKGRENVT